jgi:hypothetical protein
LKSANEQCTLSQDLNARLPEKNSRMGNENEVWLKKMRSELPKTYNFTRRRVDIEVD